jgi:VWFA-related protein
MKRGNEALVPLTMLAFLLSAWSCKAQTTVPDVQENNRQAASCETNGQEISSKTFVAILVDVSARQGKVLDVVKQTLGSFVQSVTADGNCVSLASFGSQVEELQPWTASPEKLSKAISKTSTETAPSNHADDALSRLNDAINFAIVHEFKPAMTRKVLVIIAEGNDVGSEMRFKSVLPPARDNQIRCYAILVANHAFRGSKSIRTYGWDLDELARKTHGHLFDAGSKPKHLISAFARIRSDILR